MGSFLYEALKPYIGEVRARLIADVVPPGGDVAKTSDVLAVRADLEAPRADVNGRVDSLRTEMIERIESLRTDMIDRIGRVEARVFRAGLLFFLPMWVSVWGALLVVFLQS